MTRLFRAVIEAGGVPDFDNDDLAYHEYGYAWRCQTLGVVDRERLDRSARTVLGDCYIACTVQARSIFVG